MARNEADTLTLYAPLWATLLGASATLLKKIGTHYIMNREFKLEWSDVATAVAMAAITYISFRSQYGSDRRAWYKQ